MSNERLLPLEGGRNFRDLGGYRTGEGRLVRPNTLFRSGTMHNLTDSDHAYLAKLGLRTVIDLRTTEERAAEPTAWPDDAVEHLYFDYEMENSMGELRQQFLKQQVQPDDVRKAMIGMYRSIAYDHADQYRELFGRLADDQLPLAFHCSAGKDRAGTAAALILSALGVPRETVVQDYALSDQLVDFTKEFAAKTRDARDTPYAFLAGVSLELIAPMMRSDPSYIEATFAQIELDHGSVLAFIHQELDVSDSGLGSIRDNLLE